MALHRVPRTMTRRRVSDNKIQLPPYVVANVADEKTSLIKNGPIVYWYCHPDFPVAVLANGAAKSDNLDPINESSITGVENTDLIDETPVYDRSKFDQISGGRVTIPSKLPDNVYNDLIDADEVILYSLYPNQFPSISTVWVVVVPGFVYDLKQYRRHV